MKKSSVDYGNMQQDELKYILSHVTHLFFLFLYYIFCILDFLYILFHLYFFQTTYNFIQEISRDTVFSFGHLSIKFTFLLEITALQRRGQTFVQKQIYITLFNLLAMTLSLLLNANPSHIKQPSTNKWTVHKECKCIKN